MSSTSCLKCHKMIWDKYKGMTNGSKEIHIDNNTWVLFCGNCKLKTEKKYSDFDKKYGLNKPKDQIDMIKVKELIRKDLNKKPNLEESDPEIEYVKEVKQTKVCKICKEPTRKITDYGLCEKCDVWLLHLVKSKAGKKELNKFRRSKN